MNFNVNYQYFPNLLFGSKIIGKIETKLFKYFELANNCLLRCNEFSCVLQNYVKNFSFYNYLHSTICTMILCTPISVKKCLLTYLHLNTNNY